MTAREVYKDEQIRKLQQTVEKLVLMVAMLGCLLGVCLVKIAVDAQLSKGIAIEMNWGKDHK